MSVSKVAESAADVKSSSWLASGAIAVFGLALTFGGGTLQGLWSDAFIELCSLLLLGFAVRRLLREPLPEGSKWPIWIICGLVLLLFLQLLPLPPMLWSALPGRAPILTAFQTAGIALPWEPLSLDPGATWFSLLSLLPAVSVFLAVLLLGLKTRRILSLVILGLAFLSVFLGLAQLAGGETSALRFYDPTNTDSSVGFFANRNHYASLLVVAIPISAAWAVGLAFERKAKRGLGLVPLIVAYAVLLLGLGMAHSRAGLILAFVGAVGSSALAWGGEAGRADPSKRKKLLAVLLGANLVGLGLAFQFGFVGFADRLENENVLEDLRRPIAEVTSHAIASSLPFGVGFGAFEPVYQMYEPVSVTLPAYVNHAHDDWLEIVLDGGLPALGLLLAFLVWFAGAGIRIWRQPLLAGGSVDQALARAAPIVIGLLLLHSVVDYPLRTTTLMVVFAVAAALMIPPIERDTNDTSPPPDEPRRARLSSRRGQRVSIYGGTSGRGGH